MSLGKAIYPQMLHFTQVEMSRPHVVGQRWQCVREVQRAEMAAVLYALRGVEMAHE